MKTILILAEALEKSAHGCSIARLDIQYNEKDEMYTGHLVLTGNMTLEFILGEDGCITKRER